jgi:toxin ParE1/3/4
MKVIWRERGRADLDAVVSYIANESPAGARSTRERILRSVELLEQWPDAGRSGRRADLRELVVPGTPYLIIYRRKRRKLFILRIWHSSRKR